jgi:hypothetical protein
VTRSAQSTDNISVHVPYSTNEDDSDIYNHMWTLVTARIWPEEELKGALRLSGPSVLESATFWRLVIVGLRIKVVLLMFVDVSIK